MSVAAVPDLKGSETYYGLRVSYIGDEGDVVILGHHHHEPLRVVAALNKHARAYGGLANLLDDRRAEIGDLWCRLDETYAVLLQRCSYYPYLECGRTADDPGAFPVTMWRV